MNNLHRQFLLAFIGGFLLVSTGYIKGMGVEAKLLKQPELPVYQHRGTEELVRFVDKAVAVIQVDGEEVFPEFRKRGSAWFHGEQYIFIWGLDGHRYVYPPDPDGEGKNMLSLQDIDGKPIGREFVEIARSPQGAGWCHYRWPQPGGEKPVWKSTYIRSVRSPSGKEYLVGSGMYNNKVERAFIVKAVEDAARLLAQEGRGAFDAISSPDSQYIYLDVYVFVKDMEGTELVNPFNQELIGKKILHIQDIYGKKFVRRELDILKKNDSCWMEYWWHKPNETEPSQKVVYLKKVPVGGEDLVVGVGYYLDTPVYGTWGKRVDLKGQESEGEIHINPDNTFEFLLSKEIEGHNNTSGRISLQDNRIYFSDNECTGVGIYEVSVIDRTLHLAGIEDTCSIRKRMLEGVWHMKTATAAAPKRVLLVHSYDKDFVWCAGITEGVKKAFEGVDCEIDVFYMDTRKRTDEEWKIKSGRLALDKVSSYKPDVVIAADDNAQHYFAMHLAGRDDVQAVFCGVNAEASQYGYPAQNITGILERPYPRKCADLLLRIDPRIKRLALMGDQSATTDFLFSSFEKQDDMPIEIFAYAKMGDFGIWKKAVKKYQDEADAIGFLTYRMIKDESGKIMDSRDVMDWTIANCRKPTVGIAGYMISDGALCGVVESPQIQGLEAGKIAVQMIQGNKEAGDFPISIPKQGSSMLNLTTAWEIGCSIPSEVIRSADQIIGGFDADASSILSSLVGFFEEHTMGILRSLKVLSHTRPVQEGTWEEMKGLLAIVKEEIPGVVFYVRPDGYYYTVNRNWTGMNLKDRSYFPILEQGKEVAGTLVFSRSTGKLSMVVALPVVYGDKGISGYLGMSVFMDALNEQIGTMLNLPPGMVFYVLDGEKNIALSTDYSLLFSSPARYGSKSLDQAVVDMFTQPSGITSYSLNDMEYIARYTTSNLTGWRFVLAVAGGGDAEETVEISTYTTLYRVQKNIIKAFTAMDTILSREAEILPEKALEEQAVRAALQKLYSQIPSAVDCAFVNSAGRMLYIEPDDFKGHEGADISKQEHVMRLAETKKPVLSDLFKAVEGFHALDIEWPVFSGGGDVIGSLSILIKPEFFFSGIIREVVRGTDFDVWIMQKDGIILYDDDYEEIGRNLFTDPLYAGFPELQHLGRKIAAEPTGKGTYEFLSQGLKKRVKKQAWWATITFHGTEWRLVLVEVVDD